MTVFDDDILKIEEQESGFNPGEPDDDTFFLKENEDYPGELPDFSDIKADDIKQTLNEIEENKPGEELTDVDSPQEEGIESDIIAADEGGSVWDKFDDGPDSKAEETDTNENEDITQEETVDEDAEIESITSNEDDLPEIEEIGSAYTTEMPDEEQANEEQLDEKSDEALKINESDEESVIMATPFVVDTELKNLIESELEKGKLRASAKSSEPPVENISKAPKEDFVPVEDAADTNKFNLDDIDEAVPKVEPDEINTDENADNIKAQPQEKEKDKRESVAGLILLTAAATFLITLGLGFGYLYYYTDLFDSKPAVAVSDTTIESSDITMSNEFSESSSESTNNEYSIVSGDMNESGIDESTIETDKETTMDASATSAKTATSATPKTSVAKKTSGTKETTETKNDNFQNESDRSPVDTKNTKRQNTSKKTTPSGSVARIPSDDRETDVARAGIADITKTEPTDEQIYIVQVYATPSKDDAEDWLHKLNGKNIENAFISTKKERGKTLYRVRFGNFKSKEEARTAALKYGFAQTWIDRVK